jgi:glycosyltransferase involved in cell wall biosynthesis
MNSNNATRPVRVAMVAACAFPANHGTPGAIRELSIHLERLGHEVHVVTYPQGEDIPVEGLRIHRVKTPFKDRSHIDIGPSFVRVFYDLLLVPKLISVIRREKLDVIHAHNYEACIAAGIAGFFTGKPVIYNGVTSMAEELPTYSSFARFARVARWVGRALDYVVPRLSTFIMVLSDELKDYLTDVGIADEKILIVPPGVEVDWLGSGDGDRLREELQLPTSTRVVLYTGAIDTFQRIDYLLEAMAIVCKSSPAAMLVIAGGKASDEMDALIRSQAASLGVSDRVRMIRNVPLEALPDYLALADVAVLSRPNCPGYPIKLLNYMAAAKPIVSFAGSAKSLCHGYSGYIAENDNVPDLAEGIALFLENRELGREVGAKARESLLGVFDWTTIARGVAEVYRWLMNRDSASLAAPTFAAYFKASYNPTLSNVVQLSDFHRSGVLTYPILGEPETKVAGTSASSAS